MGRRLDRTAKIRPVLSVESASNIRTDGGSVAEEMLAAADQTATASSLNSPSTSYYPSPAASTAGAPDTPPILAMCVQDCTGDHGTIRGSDSPARNSPHRGRAGSASTPRTEKRNVPSLPMRLCGPTFGGTRGQLPEVTHPAGPLAGLSVQPPGTVRLAKPEFDAPRGREHG